MATIIALVSQKGGVGKSTLARALAREAAVSGLKVKLADLDTQQGTSTNWHRRRLDAGAEPEFSVESFKTAAQAYATFLFHSAAQPGTAHCAFRRELAILRSALSAVFLAGVFAMAQPAFASGP
jgi:ABC-type cobalamin/Fe3+-siderophores transport system ATPase subunit